MIVLRNASATRANANAVTSAPLRQPPTTPTASQADEGGNILYSARAIAQFLFGSEDSRACRRVFNLWTHYQHRNEKVGLFKLKGALCLSKSQWRAFRA